MAEGALMGMIYTLLYPLGWVFYVLVPLAPVIYLVLRWRGYREGAPPEPQLGLKVVLHYFRTIGYHVLLGGGFCLLYGLWSEDQRWLLLRLAAALLITGGVVFGLHVWFLVRFSDNASRPAVSRLYNGFNALVCGLVTTGALAAGLGGALAEDPAWEMVRVCAALVVVYGASWFGQTRLLIRRTPPAAGPPPAA